MKCIVNCVVVVIIFVCSSAYSANLPLVYIVGTGGTIVGRAPTKVTRLYKAADEKARTLIKTIPQIKKIARLKFLQFLNIDSNDVSIQDWLILARTINSILQRKDVDGVVILHGTDTLEETAYFLNLVVKSCKPVVLVGAMRAATSLSADGPLNIYNAVAVASSRVAKNRGVLVVMNDRIFDARNVTKTNTTNVAAFKSYNTGPVGTVYYGKISFYSITENIHTINSVFDITKIKSLPKVVIIYNYLGQDNALFRAAITGRVDGVVFAGAGDGSIDKKNRALLKLARDKGIVIVRSSRAGSGIVTHNSLYGLDSKLGLISANNLNPQKARVLLMLSLTKTRNINKIQKFFNQY